MKRDTEPVSVRPTAFVLGLTRSGLAAIRALGREGIPVVGVDWSGWSPGSVSRYARFRRCPHPADCGRLLDFFLGEGRRLGAPGVLILARDHFADFVARHQDALRSCFLFPEVSAEALVDKRRQCQLAGQLAIPYPRTLYPESLDDLMEMRREVDYPVLIKPCLSHIFQEDFPVKGFRIDTPMQWARIGRVRGLEKHRLMLQSFIPGPSSCLYAVCVYIRRDGQTGGMYTARKIRELPANLGHATMVVTAKEPAVEEAALRYCQGMGFRGIAMVEFKWDARDEQWKFIEMNPRLWSHAALAADCGVNLALLQYKDLTGAVCPPALGFREGMVWADFVMDAQAFLRDWPQCGLTAWLRSLGRVRSFSTFSLRDPLPHLLDICLLGQGALHRLAQRRMEKPPAPGAPAS